MLHALTAACLADNGRLVESLMDKYTLEPLIALEFGMSLPPSGVDHGRPMQAISEQVSLFGFTRARKDGLRTHLPETE